jgi:hypothetical protein
MGRGKHLTQPSWNSSSGQGGSESSLASSSGLDSNSSRFSSSSPSTTSQFNDALIPPIPIINNDKVERKRSRFSAPPPLPPPPKAMPGFVRAAVRSFQRYLFTNAFFKICMNVYTHMYVYIYI